MHGLAIGHHHVVGDVDDIVNRTYAHSRQTLLHPLGTLLHVAIGHAQADVALASLLVLNLYVDGQVFVIDGEGAAVRTMQGCFVAVLLQPGIQVAGNTPMGKGIGTICGDVDFNYPVALQMIILSSRCSYYSVLREYDDAIVRSSDANLVLGTNHAQTLMTTQLSTLDLEFLVAIVEHTAHVGNNHLLTSLHIRGTTDNLLRSFSLAQVDGGEMQMRVGDVLTRQHLSYEKPFQATFNTLYFL